MIRFSHSALVATALACTGLPLSAQAPNITATKTDGTPAGTKKNAGDTVTYTNVISNAAGAGTATGVEFVDPDVAGATVVASSVRVSPVAFDDVYPHTVAANTTINTNSSTEFSVTVNDFVGKAAGATATISISTPTVTSAHGGTVTLVASGADMGKFTYSPAPGYVGPDSFSYTITNNGALSGTGTVSLTVAGQVVWYAMASGNDATGDGTLSLPFATVARAATAAGAGHKIYVGPGSFTATNSAVLAANVTLVGQGAVAAGQSFDAFVLGTTPTADTPVRPTINGTRPVITRSTGGAVVTLGEGNTILGCEISSTVAGFAISGNNINAATIGRVAPSDTRITTSGTTSSGGLSLSGGGNGTVNVNAPITTGAGNSVNISGRASGSTVNIIGKIADTGAGISLGTNNSNSTINFRSLALATTTNTSFSAVDSGTVNIANGVTDGVDNDADGTADETDEANTIVTTTGTALNLNGAVIGAGGLNFRSINSPGAGTNAGIVLRNTGTTGGLTVTGTGTAGSGGTISNKSGGNITAAASVTEYNSGTTGTGVILINTAHVSLAWMQFNDFSNYSIYGNGVTNFSLTNSVISGVSGQDAAANEGAILFGALGSGTTNGLVGNATFSNLTISGGFEDNVVIRNRAGTLSQLTVNNCTIRDNTSSSPGNEGFLVQADGTALITADFTNCSFLRNRANGIHVVTNDAGTVNVAVGQSGVASSGGTFTNNNIGVHLAHNSSGTFTAGVYQGAFSATAATFASPINVNLGAAASNPMHVTLDGNVISNANSSTGPGIRVTSNGLLSPNNILNLLANNNTISQIANRGIEIIARDGNSTINATVTNNSVQLSDPLSADAIRVDTGTTGTDTTTVNLDASGNDANTFAGLNGIRIRQRFAGTTYRLEGYSGGPSDNTAVANYLAARNPLSTPFMSDSGGAGFLTIANVPLPAAPLFFASNVSDTPAKVSGEADSLESGAAIQSVVPPVDAVAAQAPRPARPVAVSLTQGHIDSLVAEARARWEAIGLSDEQKIRLEKLRFEISDMETLQLGQASGDVIQISRGAAGNAWFIDETPADDAEFSHGSADTRRGAVAGDAAVDRVDLLTTILHEMGHTLGLCDTYSNLQRDSVMYGFLSKGERRLPAKGQATGAKPHAHAHAEPPFLTAPITIGDLPPGKSVTVIYDVVISNPPTAVPITSQGTVRSTTLPTTLPGYFADKLTDDLGSGGDPVLPGAADPTVTLVERPDTTVVSLTRASSNPRNAATVTWQIVFANAVDGVTAGNFALVNSGLGGSLVISAPTETSGPPSTTWNVTASTGTGDGSLGLNFVNDGTLTYDVTNKPFTGEVYTIDRTGPGANIVLGDATLVSGETSLVTITFSESTSGFDNSDLNVPNGTLSDVTPISSTVWTATLTPDEGVTDDTNVITLNKAGVTDALGNAGAGNAVSTNYTIDTASATVGIVVADTALKIGDTSEVTFTFSEVVTGLQIGDVSVANGSITAPSSSDGGTTWTATLTPSASVSDTSNIITLDNTGVNDSAGNPGIGTSDSNNYEIDTARPAVTIQVADDALAAGETSQVGFIFTEAVSGLTATDLTVGNGTVSDPTTLDGITWTGTLTPTANVNSASNVITLNNTGVQDLAGNAGSGTTDSDNYAIDTVRPAASSVVVANNALAAGGTSVVTITFTEAVSGLTAADFTVANGSVSAPTSSDGITWTATLTPDAEVTEATNIITLDNEGVQDVAGNAGSGTTDSNNYEIDTARPTASIVVADAELMIGETSEVTITFSEAVTGFANGDLTVPNGTLSNVVSSDDITWTATFTPTPNVTDASNVITLDNTGVADAAGNTGTGTSTSNNFSITSLSVSIVATATDAAEGTGAGNTAFTFTVSRTGSTTGEVTMNYAVTGAANAADFGGTLPSGSLVIPDTLTSAVLTINVGKDTTLEPDETFTVTLSDATGGYVISTATASSTITNDDAAAVTVAKINDGAETNTPANGLFRVTQSAASSTDTVIGYSVGGTAVAGTDYTALSGTVTIPAGSTSADIGVVVLEDSLVEATESVTIDLGLITSAHPGVTVGTTDTASLDITDNDTATVVIAKVNDGAETNTPSGGKLRVTQSATSASNTVVTYTVAGSASSGSDYSTLSGTVTILAGNTTADIDVVVLGDSVIEGTETVSVTLSGFSSGDTDIILATPASASLNITDDDAASVVIAKIGDGAEANTPTNGLFRVTQSAISATDTVVSYTVSGTASSGNDFTALAGSVTVPAGQTSSDISVPVLNDVIVESTETVSVTLTGISSGVSAIALGSTVTAILDITDNDTANVVIAKINEGAETNTPTNGLFRVTQSAVSSSNTVVTYTVAGTATTDLDYSTLTGSVTITAGQTTADIPVAVLNDGRVEATETVSVTLTGFTSGDADVSLGTTVSGSLDITDNDTANVAIEQVLNGAETGIPANAQFRMTQSAPSSTDTVLTYTVGGTATNGSDYTTLTGSVTIPAGTMVVNIPVEVLDDAVVEGQETVSLTLTGFTARDPDISLGVTLTASTIISDDDVATVAIAKLNDGNETGTPANGAFRVTQSAISASDTVVSYTVSGTASSGNDFTALTGSVTIGAGQASADISVAVLDDEIVEGTETVSVTLTGITSGGSSIALGVTKTSSLNITDNDTATVVIAKVSDGAETNTPGNGLFRVTQSAVSSSDTVVTYTVGGAAAGGSDYTALTGSVTVAAGQTTADISVAVFNDLIVETTETVAVTLSGFTAGDSDISLGATVTASLDITDNDAANIVVAKINDGAESNTPVNGLFRVTQSAISSSDTVMTYTVGGTATAGGDYTALSGSVTVPAGQVTADITLPVLNDAIVEGTETVSVTLTAITSGDADVNLSGIVTASASITDDDTATVSIAKLNDGAETNAPAGGAFRISLSAASSANTVVNVSVSGSASAGSDFTAPPASVTISAGLTSADVSIPVLNDNIIEATETVVLTLTTVSGNTAVSIAATPGNSASLDITDNDAAAAIAVSSGSPQSAVVNTAFASPLVAIVRDSGGVALGGATVTFTANGSTASGSFSTSATVLTNASGLATAPTFTANTLTGSYTVTAETPGVVGAASFELTNTPAAATHFTLVAPANVVAGEPFDVTVTALDAFNNTASGYDGTVHFTSSDSAGTLPIDTILISGSRTVSLTFVTGGNRTVTATDTVSGITGTSGAVNVSPRVDLAVTISDSPNVVNAGANLTYTINLTNHGPSAAEMPAISLTIPTDTTFVSASKPAGWATTAPAPGVTGTVQISTPGALASGASASFTVVVKVALNVVNNSTLSTTVNASSVTTELISSNNSATANTTAKSGADLQLTLTDAPDPVVAGTELVYTLQVRNNGPLDAENVSLSDVLPAGTTFVGLNVPAGWTATTPATGTNGTVAVTRPLFANGATASFTLVVKAGSNLLWGANLANTANVSSTTVDIAPSNNSATTTTAVSRSADLAAQISTRPSIAAKGANVSFFVTVTNNGPSDVSGPSVFIPIPSQMTFVSISNPGLWEASTPTVGSGSGNVTFRTGTLVTGGVATFKVVAKVNATVPNGTLITGNAEAWSTDSDPVPGNNNVSTTVAVGTVIPKVVQPVTTDIPTNSQTGLFDVTVKVTNTTPNPLNGFRLHVDYSAYKKAYPSLRLYNASSSANASDVYVDYPYPVAVDGVISLRLSFYTSTRTFPSPFKPVLTVEILPDSQVPGTNGKGVQPRLVRLDNRDVLLEFPSVAGKWYRVRYSPDMKNWYDCPVPIQAGSNRMQWIDSGPPFTNVPPSKASSRFYLVNEIKAP